MALRGLGCPARFILTGGQRGDVLQAASLLGNDRPKLVLADTAYDADHFRGAVVKAGTKAVIPSNPSRSRKIPIDKNAYKEQLNPLPWGWITYYGRFSTSSMSSLADCVNQKLKAWIMRKYKRFRSYKTQATFFLRKLVQANADFFAHWQSFGTNVFA
jgi:hypothetical protein